MSNKDYQRRRIQRKIYELFGIARYSRPSLKGLGAKLEPYIDRDGGFFVEAGANDGFKQSNTYYLERIRKWRGILVEPIKELYEHCVRRRPGSRVFHAALVADDYSQPTVQMHFAHLMSTVDGALGDEATQQAHVQRGVENMRLGNSYTVNVPARTLTSILDECAAPQIDLLSLDVEGYEPQVLAGLDLDRYRPRFMCIEARDRTRIEQIIGGHYEPVEQLTELDVLYRAFKPR